MVVEWRRREAGPEASFGLGSDGSGVEAPRSGNSKWRRREEEGWRWWGGQPVTVSFMDPEEDSMELGEMGVGGAEGRRGEQDGGQRRWWECGWRVVAQVGVVTNGGWLSSWARGAGGHQPRAGSQLRLDLADEVAGEEASRRCFSGAGRWHLVLLLGEFVVGPCPMFVCGLFIGSWSYSSKPGNDDMCFNLQLCLPSF
uniref:Uncharacterized protein n=1 Tax=Oryza punctata TaxID=4537 RepID=A0A0E0MN52_ORYPU